MESQNKEEVQTNIQRCCNCKENQRCSAISNGTQHGGKQVVQNCGTDTSEHGKDIIIRKVIQFFWCFHQTEQVARKNYRSDCHHNGNQCRQVERIRKILSELLVIPCPECLCNRNRHPCAHPCCKSDH